jgi:soluble lytic murein transglycosylase-like protein
LFAGVLLAATALLSTPAFSQARDGVHVAYARPGKAGKGPNPFLLTIERSDYRARRDATESTGRNSKPDGQFSRLIERHARGKGVDPALVHAVIRAESGYRPEAVSPKGAVGLMQLMPDTARRFGVSDPAHPESNVAAGTTYLRQLLDRFKSVPLALAAYNAGEGAVIRYGNSVPPFPETMAYVSRVLRDYAGPAISASPIQRVYIEGTRLTSRDLAPYRLLPTPHR